MKITFITFLVLISSIADAQINQNKLPGDTSLPSTAEELAKIASLDKGNYKYTVEDYFSKPKQASFDFSPDGKYLSYREKDKKGNRHIYVKNTETDAVLRVIEETEELIRGYFWANNNRLVYFKDKGGDENYQLFAVDLNGKNEKALTPFEGVKVAILEQLKDQPDFMIISMNKDNAQIFEPYRININTGELTKLHENNDISSPVSSYIFDKDGNLKAYIKQQNGTDYVIYYRNSEDEPFKDIIKTTWKDKFYIYDFDYTTPNPHDAFVISDLDNNTTEIIKYDFKTRQITEKVYKNDIYDVKSLGVSRKRGYEVDYYYYTGEKSHIVPVSDYFKKLHGKIMQEFGKYEYQITSQTDDESKYLIYIGSDKLYGRYYLYDVQKDQFKLLFDLMPNLKEEDMAEMRPINFKSRDGLTVYGYITIPQEVNSGKKVPLIVNPHGGPYGPRDVWRFNPQTQLFASRGYATIQINYRGSGGYGKKFSMAGNKQIGRNMLNDLEDGVEYAKSLGFIQEDKIAIFGASYGGLATLGSLVKTPDLYTCGVDYVGVANLFTFFNSIPPYWKPYLAQVYEQWYNAESEEDREIMRQVSPALNVDKIKKPLFVIQGANDPRVNINESDQIVSNLRNRGFEVPYMVKYNEGHGFAREENSLELYKTMLGFFAKNLK